jgi:RecA/RadA recombinase
MAASKKNKAQVVETTEIVQSDEATDSFVQSLIKDLNKDFQQKIAWNLSTDESPTHVKRWISTGSRLLDYAISNRKNGGLPEGRIVELYGPPSIGKSHIATQVAKSTQRMGSNKKWKNQLSYTRISHLFYR